MTPEIPQRQQVMDKVTKPQAAVVFRMLLSDPDLGVRCEQRNEFDIGHQTALGAPYYLQLAGDQDGLAELYSDIVLADQIAIEPLYRSNVDNTTQEEPKQQVTPKTDASISVLTNDDGRVIGGSFTPSHFSTSALAEIAERQINHGQRQIVLFSATHSKSVHPQTLQRAGKNPALKERFTKQIARGMQEAKRVYMDEKR